MNVSQVFSKLVSSQKASSAGRTLLRQIVLIMVALLLTSLFLLVTGYDPWIVFKAIYKSISTDIGGTVRWMIPYGMMGLAVALTFRMNLFNMGVDGQLYLGAIGATYISMQLGDAPRPVAILATIAFAVIAGALFAILPALLKIKLKCDEVVVTQASNFFCQGFL